MKRFAKTIVKVLIAYADIVKKEFPEHLKEERIVSRHANPYATLFLFSLMLRSPVFAKIQTSKFIDLKSCVY